MTRKRNRPPLPWDEQASRLAFPKPQHRASFDAQADTSQFAHRKIHPDRDPEYLKFLHFQPCAIKGKTNDRTGVAHICWSPEYRPGMFLSDPAHADASYSGRLKRNDSGCIALCRGAHREETGNPRRFDEDYGIDRLKLAAELRVRFQKERR